MQLDVVVSCSVDPQRLHGSRTALVDHLTVRKVDHFVVSSVNHKNNRRYAGHFVDAAT